MRIKSLHIYKKEFTIEEAEEYAKNHIQGDYAISLNDVEGYYEVYPIFEPRMKYIQCDDDNCPCKDTSEEEDILSK